MPFFIEEIVQSLFETWHPRDRERRRLAWEFTTSEIQIPSSVEGVLTARIDRLNPPERRRLLQTAAVIGRGFSLSLIPGELREDSRGACCAVFFQTSKSEEFIYEQAQYGAQSTEYIFKHALTRDAAYGSLLEQYEKRHFTEDGKSRHRGTVPRPP